MDGPRPLTEPGGLPRFLNQNVNELTYLSFKRFLEKKTSTYQYHRSKRRLMNEGLYVTKSLKRDYVLRWLISALSVFGL